MVYENVCVIWASEQWGVKTRQAGGDIKSALFFFFFFFDKRNLKNNIKSRGSKECSRAAYQKFFYSQYLLLSSVSTVVAWIVKILQSPVQTVLHDVNTLSFTIFTAWAERIYPS